MPLIDSVALNLFDEIGPLEVRRLIAFFGSPAAVLDERAGGKLKVAAIRAARKNAAREIARAAAHKIRILLESDEEYPPLLREIPDPPLVLYLSGALSAFPSIAIVGARKADAYGLAAAQGFSRGLSSSGLAIVSGLAYGVDAAAHRSALSLRDGGKNGTAAPTVAVLGSGLLRLYPSDHADLAARIVETGGGILSEFPLDTPPRRWNFPRRNRIIAGMTYGTLVIEAGAKSGSLITARLANEYGRQVWVVPNRVGDPLAEGGYALLRDGATPAAAAADILDDLSPQLGKLKRKERRASTRPLSAETKGGTEREREVVGAIGSEGATRDEILERSMISASELPRILLRLELSGRISALPGGLFRLTGLGADGSS